MESYRSRSIIGIMKKMPIKILLTQSCRREVEFDVVVEKSREEFLPTVCFVVSLSLVCLRADDVF